MSKLVLDNICRTIVGNSNRIEKKKAKTRRGGRVNRVRRGSDGFVKNLQMDKQNIDDIESTITSVANKKKQAITNLRFLITKTVHFQSMKGYNTIWKTNSLIDLEQLQKPYLYDLIQIFNIAGRSKLTNMTKMKDGISKSNVVITEAIIDGMKSTLSQKLAELGYEYNDDDVLNSSFADSLGADTSVVDSSVAGNSLPDDDVNTSLNINDHTTDNDSEGYFSLASGTSHGDDSDDTDDTNEIIENLRSVRFEKTPSYKFISPRPRTNRRSNPKRSTRLTTRNTTSKQVTARSPSSSTTQPSQSRRRGSVRNRRQSSSSAVAAKKIRQRPSSDDSFSSNSTSASITAPPGFYERQAAKTAARLSSNTTKETTATTSNTIPVRKQPSTRNKKVIHSNRKPPPPPQPSPPPHLPSTTTTAQSVSKQTINLRRSARSKR